MISVVKGENVGLGGGCNKVDMVEKCLKRSKKRKGRKGQKGQRGEKR